MRLLSLPASFPTLRFAGQAIPRGVLDRPPASVYSLR